MQPTTATPVQPKLNTLILIPVNASTLTIPTEYYHKRHKMRYALNKQGRVVRGDLIRTEDILRIGIIPGTGHYEYQWVDGDVGGEAVRDFWMESPYVKPTHCENLNLTNHLFDLKVPVLEDESAYKVVKNQLLVANYISELEGNEEELRNIAYFYNCNPTGKTTRKVYIDLLDITPIQVNGKSVPRGILLRPGIIETFFDVYTKNTDNTRISVNIRKAIALNIIEYKSSPGGGGIYYYNNIPIGSDFDKVLMYAKENPEIYSQQIVPQIRQKDGYSPISKTDQISGDPSEKNLIYEKGERVKTSSDLAAEKQELQEIAKTLKISRPRNKSIQTLEMDIKSAHELIAEAKKLGIENWEDRCEYIDDLASLIVIAKKRLEQVAEPTSL